MSKNGFSFTNKGIVEDIDLGEQETPGGDPLTKQLLASDCGKTFILSTGSYSDSAFSAGGAAIILPARDDIETGWNCSFITKDVFHFAVTGATLGMATADIAADATFVGGLAMVENDGLSVAAASDTRFALSTGFNKVVLMSGSVTTNTIKEVTQIGLKGSRIEVLNGTSDWILTGVSAISGSVTSAGSTNSIYELEV